ncbi:rod shape-determining protein MreC [Treponema phagedenis]|uniref:rod shape-determining protein MreC n=1 Tax=Treponema phagedenis TaxID=162 RepID=UPI0001F63F3D|nr:rod shape-determining protein MreC [Treponema phagedenis]EFW37486.1 rod shape-determining protein MreC [Treponema phagedenis F0421]TYT78268.1 rod shape-determining protein MreC [Treponema phagedenis]
MKKKFFFRFNSDLFLLCLFLLISSIFMAFSGGDFIVRFKTVGFTVTSGAEKAVTSASSFITDTVSAVRELAQLKIKYAELHNQLKDYELLQRTNADTKKENRELRSLLGFSQEIAIKNIPAEIIGFDPDNLYSGILINRGVKHGVKKNMPVIAFQGTNMGLVGKVVQTGRGTSMIIPLYDYQCYVAAKLEQTKYRGLINGQGRDDFPLLMRYVRKHARDDIQIGDRVVTSGENYLFPKNILIGTIREIKMHNYETSLELSIEPALDFSKLDYVFVLDLSELQKELE